MMFQYSVPYVLSLMLILISSTSSFSTAPAFFSSSASSTSAFSSSSGNDAPEVVDPAALEKARKTMTMFTNKYLERTQTYLASDPSVARSVVEGLALHKATLGKPLCPCRFYPNNDKEKAAKEGYWNCPCVPMREEKKCHCMLFLTEDSQFRGDKRTFEWTEDEEDEDGDDFEVEF
mmetsp:Transcript_23488/g.46742  ORF Transcript_23488/g.46742 Transcript_23488/m.46742 type:complete len:176 (+) Transcript_23488:164-691(+)